MKRILIESQMTALLAAIVFGSVSQDTDDARAVRYSVDIAEKIAEEIKKRSNAKREKA